ncbi:MAG TPA: NAD-dependent epimerase/dehydratase family protein [Nocardioidaceae bacterium]|nr:NAD-dependent epimerase/dehydratase family protein [Nocardioidaceae bacterium]
MSDTKVLVSGGAGFIGVNLARVLSSEGFHARCYDNFSTGRREDAEEAGYDEIVEGDILDPDSFGQAALGCRYVVHLAAQAGVPTSVADPVRDCELNVRGTLNALIAARDAGAEGFVFASSSAPLGDITPPAHEGIVPRPKSPYGASKLAGEAYCSAFAGSYDLATIALRFSNVYGPYSYHKGSVVAAFCKHAQAGEPIVIYGDGLQTRDFIYVDDICAGIAGAMSSGAKGAVAHLASGVETTVLDVADEIASRFEGDIAVEHRPPRAGDVLRSSADISGARSLFGFEPSVALGEGLDHTIGWFQQSSG